MDAEWIKSPSARRILALWTDRRPAWLWRGDGGKLLWRNGASRWFAAGSAQAEAGSAAEAAPIRGQVARLLRLGLPNRTSPARLQFLLEGRPVSATCLCTPVLLEGGALGLLIVGADPVVPADLAPAETIGVASTALFAEGARYLLLDGEGNPAGGTIADPETLRAALPGAPMEPGESRALRLGAEEVTVTCFTAGPDGASLLLVEGARAASPETAAGGEHGETTEAPASDEPYLPLGLAPLPPSAAPPEAQEPPDEGSEEEPDRSLSSLFDRLAEDAQLYSSLDLPAAEPPSPEGESAVAEDFEPAAPPPDSTGGEAAEPPMVEPEETPDTASPDEDAPGAEESTADTEDSAADVEPEVHPQASGEPALYHVTGRSFRPAEGNGESESVRDGAEEPDGEAPPAPDAEALERVSRYNFDELSRILTDRIGSEERRRESAEQPEATRAGAVIARPFGQTAARPEGQLVNLSGEPFILNRLPLGILVFRDQQVLFANRSFTEMVGYRSGEDVRAAGLGSMFPAMGSEAHEAGPINHLVGRDGTLLPVTARLQSISWQGRPALMLSASATEVRTGHEAAVRAFAELIAEAREEGFLELQRNGTIAMASGRAKLFLGRQDGDLRGVALPAVLEPSESRRLQAFLERPARFAETVRPTITLKGAEPGTELVVFAQGQAGVVTGYFALVRQRAGSAPVSSAPGEIDPAVLTRLSRGIRQPLNSIVGFAELIRSAPFGEPADDRTLGYARDIRTAGLEIAALMDELDDFARLKEGRFAVRPADIDLAALLDSCIVRVRAQAGVRRVLVRSAVSEALPRIRVDRAALGQAVLNLLWSAIGETPPGGSIVISAHADDDGSIAINVRDSSKRAGDPSERLSVFHEEAAEGSGGGNPIPSSVGLALTRSLLEVNSSTLSIETLGATGTLFAIVIPPERAVPTLLSAAD
jgi:signal transduction histidine kinase